MALQLGKLLQVTFHGCVTCQFAPLLEYVGVEMVKICENHSKRVVWCGANLLKLT